MRILRVIDLSVPVDGSTVVYPGDPVPRFEPHCTIERDGFNVLAVQVGSQSGTHLDAPYHFEPDGARVDELPIEQFVGPAVVVEATGLAPRSEIGWELVAPVADRIGPESVVLLHTGWSEHYGSPAYFAHPYLSPEAAERMLERGARTFCIDALSVDETPDPGTPGESTTAGFPAHHLILRAGGVIGENFTNLGALGAAEHLVVCTPIRYVGADGGPVRAVAIQLGP